MERVTLSRKHLLALKAICHFSDQTSNLLRSLWSISALLMLLTNPYRRLSSANRPHSEVIWRPMSLMYPKNISGPRTVPWGTPEVTVTGEDSEPLTTTFWVLPQSQDSIRLISCRRISWWSNFLRRRLCGTVSNAFEKSSNNTSVCFPWSKFLAMSSTIVISWLSHERPRRNPCW